MTTSKSGVPPFVEPVIVKRSSENCSFHLQASWVPVLDVQVQREHILQFSFLLLPFCRFDSCTRTLRNVRIGSMVEKYRHDITIVLQPETNDDSCNFLFGLFVEDLEPSRRPTGPPGCSTPPPPIAALLHACASPPIPPQPRFLSRTRDGNERSQSGDACSACIASGCGGGSKECSGSRSLECSLCVIGG